MSTAVEWRRECSPDLNHDVPEDSIEEDDKLKEHWSRKDRRRSSILKDFAGDSLGLKENQRICMYLAKFGKKRAVSELFMRCGITFRTSCI